jgi:hypothetical protein
MKKFGDFAQEKILDGEKLRIEDVLNEEVEMLNFSVKTSKYPKNSSGKYLTLQIRREKRKYVIFTGSDVLIEQLEKYGSELPFLATIRKINRYYSLT